MSFICNTTVLSNFATIKQLGLLQYVFPQLYIPTAVYDEIYNGLEEGYLFYRPLLPLIYPTNQAKTGWINIITIEGFEELQTLNTLPRQLHRGEAECLTIAQHRDWLFLTDDQAARRLARHRNIELSGTLGCLVIAVEQSYCSLANANEYLAQMIESGYRSPLRDIAPLLDIST